MRYKLIKPILASASLAASLASAQAGVELLTNGNFETGTFAGWSVADQAGGSGTFFIDMPLTTTPLGDLITIGGPANGSFYAVSDQSGPGAHALLQSFIVPAGASSVILSFDMFVNHYDTGPIVNPAGLDYTASPNQHARVDILSSAATAFDTGVGVLANYYLGVDGGAYPNAFTPYSFDITALVGAGGTFQLRFAEVDTQSSFLLGFFFNQGVDNVSIEATVGVPDSGSTMLLMGISCVLLAGGRSRK